MESNTDVTLAFPDRERQPGHGSLESLPDRLERGMIICGVYRVVKKLGAGGMGTVYLVEEPADGHPYAVKTFHRIPGKDEQYHRVFFREIRTWMDLPPHPHLTRCHFVRTVGKHLVVFSEYMDGGSLESWIRRGQPLPLPWILDAAIQIAWGLQAAHDYGVIHQDVKPANILIGGNGVLKLTDFGLSILRLLRTDPGESAPPSATTRASSPGLTPAFCSPEQSEMEPVDYRSDIWNFGLTLLAMFSGGAQWTVGCLGEMILESVLRQKPGIPDPVVRIIRRCLKPQRDERWESMQEIADLLTDLYPSLTGEKYFREQPHLIPRIVSARDTVPYQNFREISPEFWLKKALTAAVQPRQNRDTEGDEDPEQPIATASMTAQTSRAQRIRNIELFSRAERLYRRILAGSHTSAESMNQRHDFGVLLYYKSLSHLAVDDFEGALSCLKESDDISREICGVHPGAEALRHRISVLVTMSGIAHLSGQYDRAMEILNTAESVVNDIPPGIPPGRLNDLVSKIYLNRAVVARLLGRPDTAAADSRKCIEIREAMARESDEVRIWEQLSRAYTNYSILLQKTGDYDAAIQVVEKAIDIRERIVRWDTDVGQMRNLALVYQNKGVIAHAMDDLDTAMAAGERARQILERLVTVGNCGSYRQDLAKVILNLGNVFVSGKNLRQAREYYGRALTIQETLLHERGSHDSRIQIAQLHTNIADCEFLMNNTADAQSHLERAETLYSELARLGYTGETSCDIDRLRRMREVYLSSSDASSSQL